MILTAYEGIFFDVKTFNELTKTRQCILFEKLPEIRFEIHDEGVRFVKYSTEPSKVPHLTQCDKLISIDKNEFINDSGKFEDFVTECVNLINFIELVSPAINVRTREARGDCLSAILRRAFDLYDVDLNTSANERKLYDIIKTANKGVEINSSGMVMKYQPEYHAYYKGMMLFSEIEPEEVI